MVAMSDESHVLCRSSAGFRQLHMIDLLVSGVVGKGRKALARASLNRSGCTLLR
jgi:hypothetical protein